MAGKPKSVPLWQEIALALALKAVVLALIWNAWFSEPEDRNLDAPQVASQILSPQSLKEHDHDAVHRAR